MVDTKIKYRKETETYKLRAKTFLLFDYYKN